MNKPVDIALRIESLVMSLHRRNGGHLTALDSSLRLLDPSLGLDSLDLAEVMAVLEKEYGVSPFNSSRPPRSWADVIAIISSKG